MATAIGVASRATLLPAPTARVYGGSISECYRWDSESGSIVVKDRGILAGPGTRSLASQDCGCLPSLLHGDLWGGNWATDDHAQPVIFDPAVYYGDREADVAMTRLFGGFGADFYFGYQATWPGEDQHSTRLRPFRFAS
jgi:hypothetical protein